MNQIKDLVFPQDFFKLPKAVLSEIATELNVDSSKNKNELALDVFEEIREQEIPQGTLMSFESKVFATKTSVTWYRIDDSISQEDFIRLINQNAGFDASTGLLEIAEDEVTTEPQLLGLCQGHKDTDVIVRLIYKDSVRYEPSATSVRAVSKTSIATVYYDQNKGIIEVRGDTRKARDIAIKVAGLLNQTVNLEPVTDVFEREIGDIADNLSGELVEAKSKPQHYLEEYTDEETQSVIDVLSALDRYIETKDSDVLETSLQQISDSFGYKNGIVPFAALVLSGMETVGMQGNSEIRSLPLYSYLDPYLSHQNGFIKFPFRERNVEDEYTIRVGMTTKSVVFVSHVTESLIDYVRENVII
ncbi:hypothetical protein AAV35_012590 [Salimicrobium jeotgali]|uniref:Uncharacterized protein n=1 Tax=Salimicrobium jeotgali TaxID=1230341 RepID=K2GJ69_9BACI|nr:hypothetical protein [Salimicrobium jeotgali]AKG05510.1 hypothetical protein AAV35_012590 [Salimicrobium jeotgali]EKE30509.1 hypothetical protein MJ3_13749 [Salimicrobium jeotgali]MBM7696658.1 hypothetical protein [Salimicrobium jeotgali]